MNRKTLALEMVDEIKLADRFERFPGEQGCNLCNTVSEMIRCDPRFIYTVVPEVLWDLAFEHDTPSPNRISEIVDLYLDTHFGKAPPLFLTRLLIEPLEQVVRRTFTVVSDWLQNELDKDRPAEPCPVSEYLDK